MALPTMALLRRYLLRRHLVVDEARALPGRVRQRDPRPRRPVGLAAGHHVRHVARELSPRLALLRQPLRVGLLVRRRLVDATEEPREWRVRLARVRAGAGAGATANRARAARCSEGRLG